MAIYIYSDSLIIIIFFFLPSPVPLGLRIQAWSTVKLTSPHGDQTPGPWSQLASFQVGLETVQLPDKMAGLILNTGRII